MIPLEDIKVYLPKYLSEESTTSLFKELSQFPDNIDSRMYSGIAMKENNEILQGDGLIDLLTINLPNPRIEPQKAIVISNSCDIDPNNERLYASSICYCPIINLQKFQNILKSKHSSHNYTRIDQFISEITKQRVSQIFYLPRGEKLDYDGFIFFDKICCCDNAKVKRKDLYNRRLFTLSNYGFYLFLFKLSIHFTRIREVYDREKV
jgi:hypothetical protein